MKRNARKQLIALLEGLNLPSMIEGKSLLDHLDSTPKQMKETGIMVGRLANIGLQSVQDNWKENNPEEGEQGEN